jgi:hypothetical protein
MTSAIEAIRSRPRHAYVVLPSRACLQLRRPTQAQLLEHGLAMLTGLADAAEVGQEAIDEAQVAAHVTNAAAIERDRQKLIEKRMLKFGAAVAKRPELLDQLQGQYDAWVCASVVAIGIAAPDVEPGFYVDPPALYEAGELEAVTLTRDASAAGERVLHVEDLVPGERAAIAAAAQRHASAKEQLRPLGSATRPPAGV